MHTVDVKDLSPTTLQRIRELKGRTLPKKGTMLGTFTVEDWKKIVEKYPKGTYREEVLRRLTGQRYTKPGKHDIDGSPMTLMEWACAFNKKRHVARTTLPSGVRISTVWLGLDHSNGLIETSKPLIFETMVFAKDTVLNDLWCKRTSTILEAQLAHLEAEDKFAEGK